jgi:hypothetical protein
MQNGLFIENCGSNLIFIRYLRFQDLTAVTTNIIVVWDVTPYSVVKTLPTFGGTYNLYLQCRGIYALFTSEEKAPIYQQDKKPVIEPRLSSP